MVLPLIFGGAAVAARFLIPRLLPIALKGARFVLPKTIKGAVVQAVVVPTAIGIFTKSKTARKVVTTTLDPRTGFERGGLIAEKIESLDAPSKEKVIGGAAAAGVLGAVVAGGLIVAPKILAKIPKKKPKGVAAEKPIMPETQIIETTPTPLKTPGPATGMMPGINIDINLSQRTKRIKNIVIFQ